MASLFVDVVDSPYLNKFVLSCMMKNGELFFYCLESLNCPEAKDQVRIFMFLQAVMLYHISVMIIFICGFECKVVKCFSSRKSS